MDFANVNWWAVALCGVACMASGFVWYNPKTFFPIWWEAIGKGEETPGGENMGMVWTLTLVSSFIQPIIFALILPLFGPSMGGLNALNGMLTGAVLWLGFIAPTYLVNTLFAGHSLKVWAIETGNHLINFMIFGLILGAWRI